MGDTTQIHSEDNANWGVVHLDLTPFESVPLVSIYPDAFDAPDYYKGVVMTGHQFDMLVAHVHAVRAQRAELS